MGCGSLWVWYGRCGVLFAGSSARCDARSAPSVMIDSLPSGATSASLAYQSVSVAVEAATTCSAIGPARARARGDGAGGEGKVGGAGERRGAEGQPLRVLEPLVGRHVRRRGDRAVVVEGHAEAGRGV